MPDPLYGLTAEDVRFLRTLKRKELTGENVPRPRYQRKGLPFRYDDAKVAKNGASAIAARSGLQMTGGEVTIYEADDDGLLSATSDTKVAYNLSGTAVAADAYLMIGLIGSLWYVMWEDCT